MSYSASRLRTLSITLIGCLIVAGCAASAKNSIFFGKTEPPRDNILRYVSGSEPETIDPQIPNAQNEARICLALYEGLAEYDPKTSEAIPALAERWEINKDSSEFTFHLRHDGRFSNGDPITARDFVYTIRRGMTPELGSRSAALAYYIKYAKAFNEHGVFVQDPTSGAFLLEKDFVEPQTKQPLSTQPTETVATEYPSIPEEKMPDADTPFHRIKHSPNRVVVPVDANDQ